MWKMLSNFKSKKQTYMNNTIQLNDVVMVSDPCYTIPTWCQTKLTDVLPGEYIPMVHKTSDTGGWGTRIAVLQAVHKDYINDSLSWREYPGEVGVDSGQAGIFSIESYRNDEIAESITTPDSKFNIGRDGDGDAWYEKMCQFTLSDNQWGSYDTGVVSSSGIGDGGYRCLVAKKNGKIVGIAIDYLLFGSTFRNKDINTLREEFLMETAN